MKLILVFDKLFQLPTKPSFSNSPVTIDCNHTLAHTPHQFVNVFCEFTSIECIVCKGGNGLIGHDRLRELHRRCYPNKDGGFNNESGLGRIYSTKLDAGIFVRIENLFEQPQTPRHHKNRGALRAVLAQRKTVLSKNSTSRNSKILPPFQGPYQKCQHRSPSAFR